LNCKRANATSRRLNQDAFPGLEMAEARQRLIGSESLQGQCNRLYGIQALGHRRSQGGWHGEIFGIATLRYQRENPTSHRHLSGSFCFRDDSPYHLYARSGWKSYGISSEHSLQAPSSM
jgi:hypothetical protein